MIHLDSLLEIVNTEIKSGISTLRYSVNGLVRTIEKGNETITYDANENTIIFSDDFDLFLYHKLVSGSFEEVQAAGKKHKYNRVDKLDLFCYAKSRSAQDYMIDRLASVRDLVITGIDNDSAKIFKEETGSDGFDTSHYVFKISYELKYSSDKCNTCLTTC